MTIGEERKPLHCNVCGYTWTPRPVRFEQGRDKPRKCPNCQSTDWDKQGT